MNAQCVEVGQKANLSQFGGLCACKENYKFNKNYSESDKSSLYCIEDNKIVPISTTAVPVSTAAPIKSTERTVTTTTTTTKKPETLKTTSAPSPQVTTKKVELATTTKPLNESSNNSSKSNNNNNDKQPEQQKQVDAPTHHMFGGIVLPVMIVLAFIGAVYGIRKYDVLERAQNYIRNRRNGGQPHQTRYDGLENDFDDDPLLI